LSLVIDGLALGDDVLAGAQIGILGITVPGMSDRLTRVIARGLLGAPSGA